MDILNIVFALFKSPLFNDPKPVCPLDITAGTAGYELTRASLGHVHGDTSICILLADV